MTTKIIKLPIYETSCDRCQKVIPALGLPESQTASLTLRQMRRGLVEGDIDLCITCVIAFDKFMKSEQMEPPF